MAFELAKCEYKKFGEPLPTKCSFQGRMAFRTSNEDLFHNCMSPLSRDTWLGIWIAFAQYKLSGRNLCMKLTDDLEIH